MTKKISKREKKVIAILNNNSQDNANGEVFLNEGTSREELNAMSDAEIDALYAAITEGDL